MLESDESLLNKYQDKFKYILSDEYQDTSKNKAKLIDLLGRKNGNVFVVGDFLQNIYSSFTGSDNKYICEFPTEYNSTVINLNINYRCSEDIVNVSNKFALTIPETKHPNYVESIANKPKFKKPEFTECEDVELECKYVVDKINNLISNENYQYQDLGILARTNAMLQNLELSLAQNNIPYLMNGGISFIEEPEIKLVLSYLKLADNEFDNYSFEYCYNKPNRWLAKQFLEEVKSKCTFKNNSYFQNMARIDRRNWRFKNGIDELYEVINMLQNKKFKDLSKAVDYIRDRLDIDNFIANKNLSKTKEEIVDNLDSFAEICKGFKDVKDIIKYFNDLEIRNKNNKDDNKLNLMTIHRSKGLEFPIVFVVGCNENYLPHQKSIDLDEERRLFYVAMTRAERELYLSSANFRRGNINSVSRFINDIKNNIIIKDEIKTNKLN
jgi:DNA helicase-2/ATP-dependent DNA helicase PcrA